MRPLLLFVVTVGLAAGGAFRLLPRTTFCEGRVLLHDMEGRVMPGAGARVAWHPADEVEEALGSWWRRYDESSEEIRRQQQAARRIWEEMSARRDEAARILRVAERDNSADLALSRARHREAAADAEEALQRLERNEAEVGEGADLRNFLDHLSRASAESIADARGIFRAELPRGPDLFLVGSLPGASEAEPTLLWLRRGPFGQAEEVLLSNADILTAGQLAAMARAQKKPGSPAGSPAEASVTGLSPSR